MFAYKFRLFGNSSLSRSKPIAGPTKLTMARLAKRIAIPTRALVILSLAASTLVLSPPEVSQDRPPHKRKSRTANPPRVMTVRQRVTTNWANSEPLSL